MPSALLLIQVTGKVVFRLLLPLPLQFRLLVKSSLLLAVVTVFSSWFVFGASIWPSNLEPSLIADSWLASNTRHWRQTREKNAFLEEDHTRSTRPEVGVLETKKKYKEESLKDDPYSERPRWQSLTKVQMSQILSCMELCLLFWKIFPKFCTLIRLAVNSVVLGHARLPRVCVVNLGERRAGVKFFKLFLLHLTTDQSI